MIYQYRRVVSRLPVASRASTTNAATSIIDIKKAKLGGSNLEVSEVCLGTMTFGEQTGEKDAHQQLSLALDSGVNFLDTAEVYPVSPTRETAGATSRTIGSWLRNQKRDSIVIATKVAGRNSGLKWIPSKRTDPPGPESGPVLDGPAIAAAADGELRRLGTDYIDLFQLHWPDRYVPNFGSHQYRPESEYQYTPFEEQVEAVGKLIQSGKIRHWGLSNETPFGVTMQCLAADRLGVPRPVTIQNSYSLIHRTFEGHLAEVCSPGNFNLGLLPWSALSGGTLSGKYDGEYPPGSRMALWPDRYARFHSPRALAAAKKYAAIAREAGLSPVQLAYGFCRSRWFIPSVIIGASSVEQLRHNLTAFGPPLSEEVLAAVDQVHVEQRDPSLKD